MKKIDKIKLSIKDKIVRFTSLYLATILSFQTAGTIQDIFNYKAIKEYNKLVDDFGDFLNSNDIKDPTEIFDYYSYALWGGYLSKDHNFKFNTDRELFFSSYGLGCVLGDAVCLNNSGMLRDLYESMGFDADVIICYMPEECNIDNFKDEIDIETIEDTSNWNAIFDLFTFLIGNHAITLVEYNGEYYYYDSTNLAYLFKSDINALDIINGNGTYTRRNLTSFFFNPNSAIKGLFACNDKSYNLEYLITNKTTDIDITKLEEFYQSEKETIDGIYDSLKGKSQLIIFLLLVIISRLFIDKLICILFKIINNKNITNEDKLKRIISLFIAEVSLDKFEDICCYISYLIKYGYLSVDDENLRIKESILFKTPALVVIDKKEYGDKFFEQYIVERFKKVKKIKCFNALNILKDFYVLHDENSYKYFCFDDDKMYQTNENHDEIIPIEKIPFDFQKALEFKEKNQQIIDDIANDYINVKKLNL